MPYYSFNPFVQRAVYPAGTSNSNIPFPDELVPIWGEFEPRVTHPLP